MFDANLPDRVRVLVLGGGIHGVGVLHDMATRGWQDVHLVEKSTLASGTSTASTKLIHGGLRYLKRIRDFGLVIEALRERKLLMELAPDLVKPVELYFPVLKSGGMPRFIIKIGLLLYDFLAGKYRIGSHKWVAKSQVKQDCPHLDLEKITAVYSFFDGQTDDYALVHRAAESAVKLGANISENTKVIAVAESEDGWDVVVEDSQGERKSISALYVVNCLGPWSGDFLEKSEIKPTHYGINNKGIHLLLPDLGIKKGMFLQARDDERIFFVLPWYGLTLVGTTEELYEGNPDDLAVKGEEVDYLLRHLNYYMDQPIERQQILKVFAGLRWLVADPNGSLTATTRSHEIGEISGKRGLLLTIYGGKLTTYREMAKLIGNKITTDFGEFKPSNTDRPDNWVRPEEARPLPLDILARFQDI